MAHRGQWLKQRVRHVTSRLVTLAGARGLAKILLTFPRNAGHLVRKISRVSRIVNNFLLTLYTVTVATAIHLLAQLGFDIYILTPKPKVYRQLQFDKT